MKTALPRVVLLLMLLLLLNLNLQGARRLAVPFMLPNNQQIITNFLIQ